MIGNHWDATTEDVERFQEGQVVYLEGKRDEYKGTPQLRIQTLRLADDSEPNNPELYVKRAPLKKEEMIDYLNKVIFEITNPTMNRIVRELMNRYQKKFFSHPLQKPIIMLFMVG